MTTPPSITPQEFVDKWRSATLKERSAYQEHFIDLCRLIGHSTPAEVDPTGENFAFEYGATKTTGGSGFADVFKRRCFALDAAVFAAYGWPPDLSDDEILARLLAQNLERASRG